MKFEFIPTNLSDHIKIILVTEDNVCTGIIQASVDSEKYHNICVMYFSDINMLRAFARTQNLDVFISIPKGAETQQQEEWLIKATDAEVDTTLWYDNTSVDVYRVEP